MKISEMVHLLTQIQAEHGDLEVETTGWDGARRPSPEPLVDFRALLHGRETKPRFASYYFDDIGRTGDKVCRL